MGRLGNLGGAVIAVFFLQRRHQHQRVFEAALNIVEARLNADNAVFSEADCGVGQQANRLQEIIGHHRVEHVQLEVTLRPCETDCGIVAVNVRADLCQRFTLGRVHLARHDGAARFVFWQSQFAKAGTRSGPEEADVVRNLEAGHSHRGDRAMREHHRVMRGQRFELVRCRRELQAGDCRDLFSDFLGEPYRRGETGADGRAALRQFHQLRQGQFDPLDAVLQLLGIAGEFLAERDRRGVLRVRAANLDDVSPFLGFGIERIVQNLQRRDQAVNDFLGAGDVHRCRECVV